MTRTATSAAQRAAALVDELEQRAATSAAQVNGLFEDADASWRGHALAYRAAAELAAKLAATLEDDAAPLLTSDQHNAARVAAELELEEVYADVVLEDQARTAQRDAALEELVAHFQRTADANAAALGRRTTSDADRQNASARAACYANAARLLADALEPAD